MGENRVMRQAQLLRALDFCIPVSAFDEAAHELHVMLPGDAHHLLNQLNRPGLVGLQSQAKTAPLRVMGCNFFHDGFKDAEREFEALHFFRINGEVHMGLGGLLAKLPNARHQLLHHPLMLAPFVARMQGGELDGDAIAGLSCALRVFLAISPDGICAECYMFYSV